MVFVRFPFPILLSFNLSNNLFQSRILNCKTNCVYTLVSFQVGGRKAGRKAQIYKTRVFLSLKTVN